MKNPRRDAVFARYLRPAGSLSIRLLLAVSPGFNAQLTPLLTLDDARATFTQATR